MVNFPISMYVVCSLPADEVVVVFDGEARDVPESGIVVTVRERRPTVAT